MWDIWDDRRRHDSEREGERERESFGYGTKKKKREGGVGAGEGFEREGGSVDFEGERENVMEGNIVNLFC